MTRPLRSLRIAILLPAPPPFPIGGCKVAYQYANHLVARGHKVDVVHFQNLEPAPTLWRMFTRWRDERSRSRRIRDIISWFPFDPRVRVRSIPDPRPIHLPRADFTIATAWKTAPFVEQCPKKIRGKGLYLLQHVEDWDASRETVLDTWRLPLQKIVISHWLEDLATSLGEPSRYIPNGLDFEEFGVDCAPSQRDPFKIGMLWHDLEWKGSRSGLEALKIVKQAHPNTTAEFFGTGPAPSDLPNWATYHQQPSRKDLRALYNRCAIFTTPSHAEGWALPPAESMQCGCALVATEIGGHKDYAIDRETAFTFAPGNPASQANAIISLLENSDRRIELAHRGHAWIQQFTWQRATDSLVTLLREMT